MSKRLELFDKLLAGGSTDPFHHYARALELRSLGRREDALGALAGTLTAFPDYVPSYLMAAQLAAELGQGADAAGYAQRGIDTARRVGNGHALSELESLLAGLSDGAGAP
jgi:tetratricopeptide (TPR) repeat protein